MLFLQKIYIKLSFPTNSTIWNYALFKMVMFVVRNEISHFSQRRKISSSPAFWQPVLWPCLVRHLTGIKIPFWIEKCWVKSFVVEGILSSESACLVLWAITNFQWNMFIFVGQSNFQWKHSIFHWNIAIFIEQT